MIERLELLNFIAFSELKLELSSKLNVIIGENGTGKTQILKALYFANKSLAQKESHVAELLRLFRPLSCSLKGLVGEDGKSKAALKCDLALGQTISLHFSANSKKLAQEKFVTSPAVGSPNLIPVKEVLSLMKGILAIKAHPDTLDLLFDQSYLDIAKSLAIAPGAEAGKKIDQDPRFSEIYLKLVELLGGRFEVTDSKNEPVVAFKAGHYERVKDTKSENYGQLTFRVKRSDSADMTAEGLRKLGTLQLLLENRQLNPGRSGVLIWDEPEANLNPKLMRLVVELLLELTRNGQQVVVATHDYVLLKWFDLLMDKGKGDDIKFHSLYRNPDNHEISVFTTDDYLSIHPNPIDDAYGYLVDQEISNDMGDLGK